MGLFRKNKKDKKNNVQAAPETITNDEKITTENKNTEMEIIELDKNDVKSLIKKINRKENMILFGIIGILIVFAYLLPTITGLVSKNSIFTYNRVVEDITSTQTVDGMLEIGKDVGSITAKNIQFYNPTKRGNNTVQLVYLPENNIKNISDLNIYVEIYNANKVIIYREKFNVTSLERKVQGTLQMKLNSNIYSESAYVKIVIISDEEFNSVKETLICTRELDDDEFNVNEKITYSLSDKGLISYQVLKNAEAKEGALNTNKYAIIYEKEASNLEDITDVKYDKESITYNVDVKNFNNKKNYELLYKIGSVKRQIKLNEESKGWSCK